MISFPFMVNEIMRSVALLAVISGVALCQNTLRTYARLLRTVARACRTAKKRFAELGLELGSARRNAHPDRRLFQAESSSIPC